MKKPKFDIFFSTYLNEPIPEDYTGEHRCNCPLPDCPNSEDHFYANCSDGTWHCKRCDTSGNARTLITLIHQKYLHSTTPSQYESLSEVRGISAQTLEDAGFAYDYDNDRWLVPYYTYDPLKKDWSDFLNNLGYFYPGSTNEKSRFTIKKGSGLSTYLYNPGLHAYPPSKIVVICEGEWDTLAYIEANPNSKDMIVGKPGAGFNANFLKTLEGIETANLLLDNDDAGRKQTASATSVLSTHCKHINILDWSLVEDAPKDIRDLYMREGDALPTIIGKSMVPYTDITKEEPVNAYTTSIQDYEKVESFDTYIENAQKFLYLTDETKLAMAATIGITNSISIEGEPLWAFLIGPPSSGKTTFIDSFGGNNELFDNLSKISAKSLVSGWKDDTGEEPSYLAKLRNKSLFVKDFTVTLTDSPDSQREVFGLLTDIFDGYVKIPYGNNQVREFSDLYFNMIAGVTDIVHKHSAASIGERFLRIDYLGKQYDSREFAKRALLNFGKAKGQRQSLTSNTLGFIRHLKSFPIVNDIEENHLDPLVDLAEFIATIRTKVESDAKEGIQYRPRPELPSRLAFQLAKLYVSTRAVFCPYGTEEETVAAGIRAFKVVRKVALDTCYGFSLDIIKSIMEYPQADRQLIASKANISSQRAYRVLKDLETTGAITQTSGRVGSSGGRPKHCFEVNPKIKAALFDEIKDPTERRRKKHPTRSPRRIRKQS